MTDIDQRNRLSKLLLQALEVGTGKHERDVLDELFSAFGLKWTEIDAEVAQRTPDRAIVLRASAASRLADAAPSAEAILNVVARCGGRFISMLEEIYARLAQHSTSTSGTSESFRLKRSGVDETLLTISPAFLEQVSHVLDVVQYTPVGVIDDEALKSFTRWDNGVSYGSWSTNGVGDQVRLVNAVLDLSWVGPRLRELEGNDPNWASAASLLKEAYAAAESLVSTAEALVRSHAAHIDGFADKDAGSIARKVFKAGATDRLQDYHVEEIERFRVQRSFSMTACQGFVRDIKDLATVGLGEDFNPEIRPSDGYYYGSGVSDLAGLVAQYKLRLWAERDRPGTEGQIFQSPTTLESWLTWVIYSSREARAWLENEVREITNEIDISRRIEAIEEFLNLPLWKQRDLIYEVWILCATLKACEDAEWDVELCSLSSEDGAWVLSTSPTEFPVARLRLNANKSVTLDVWREPKRITTTGILTPDLAVSTPEPYIRDLLVVEAKDRMKMAVGQQAQARAFHDQKDLKNNSALGVASRYALGLRPNATWICNHCDFRQDISPSTNHGDVWNRIHLADQFRPGHVPESFTESVKIALSPTQGADSKAEAKPRPNPGLVVVVDVTGSMHSRIESAFEMLDSLGEIPFEATRAVLFSDHWDNEPFLVRELGPYADLPQLVESVRTQPLGSGGDVEEALEDAMQRCRELVEVDGPQAILVLTDAPPHSTAVCPHEIDFSAEVQSLLNSGCQLMVAGDWMNPADRTWSEFVGTPGFTLASLRDLVASLKKGV